MAKSAKATAMKALNRVLAANKKKEPLIEQKQAELKPKLQQKKNEVKIWIKKVNNLFFSKTQNSNQKLIKIKF